MLTSARSAFLHCSRTTSLTSRTAVYGPVRTVVWQGSAGNCRPYADQTPQYLEIGFPWIVGDPDRTPPFSSMPEIGSDESQWQATSDREVELVAVRVRDDHEPVAPLPVHHIHAAPFQLSAQGIQHADI